jgi:hypothetical protein
MVKLLAQRLKEISRKMKLDTCSCGHKQKDHRSVPVMLGVKGTIGPCRKCKCKEFGHEKSWDKLTKEMQAKLDKELENE